MDRYGLLNNIADAAKVAPMQPWALSLYRERQRAFLQYDPMLLGCKPPGGPRQFQQPYGFQFVEQPDFVWGLIASMYIGNIAGLIVVLTTVPLFAAILRIPFSIIAPVIIAICAVGAYTVNNAMLDMSFMLVFGIIGYVFKKLSYPLAPLVLALVLGDMAEANFRNAMILSDGSLSIFWSNGLVGTICGLAILMLCWPAISYVLHRLGPGAGGGQGNQVTGDGRSAAP
jgi:putative tricarboxylic transport membrane protein